MGTEPSIDSEESRETDSPSSRDRREKRPTNTAVNPTSTISMKRRTFLASAAVLSATGIAGCVGLSDDGTSTVTSTPAETTGNETASPEMTPTRDPSVQRGLETVRSELEAAFEWVHSLGFYRDGRLSADPEKFKTYEPEQAQSHVESAREALQGMETSVDSDSELGDRITVLRDVARIAAEGARLYNNVRNVFRETWAYEYAKEHGYYEKAVERIEEARRFLEEVKSHRRAVANALETVGGADVTPRVEEFDYATWVNIARAVRNRVPRLSATIRGFEEYTRATVRDGNGIEALDSGDADSALRSFRSAVEAINESRELLRTAIGREAGFFRDRVDAYACRAPGMKEAFELHIRAAEALAEGQDKRAEELREQGFDRMGQAVDGCPN